MNFMLMDEDTILSTITVLLVVACGISNIVMTFYRTEVHNNDEYVAFRDIV